MIYASLIAQVGLAKIFIKESDWKGLSPVNFSYNIQ